MAATNQPDNPSYVCATASRQLAALTICRDLSGGTPAMRKAGKTYLPKEEGEGSQAYKVRLSRSLLFNTFVKVREGLVGMALKKRDPAAASDIELDKDVPSLIRQHVEDIDLNGNHLDVFAKELFRDVINDGHAFILVDMQPPLPFSVTSASPIPDASDEIAAGRRPYWVKYRKDQAINWKHDRLSGRITLTQITFEERVTRSDGAYGEKDVVRYRVLRLPLLVRESPGRPAIYGSMEWELYEKVVVSDKEALERIDGGKTTLTRIPIIPIYARRTGCFESQPPLLDLAYLNVGHWQQWSDLNCQLRMLVPILVIHGELVAPPAPEGAVPQPIKIGPGAALQFKDDKGGAEYTSHDGAAIEAARQSLVDLEQRMSAVGLSIISQKQDTEVTATEKAMDQDERQSELASWVRALKDGLEAALQFHAIYLGLPTGGSVLLGFDEAGAQPEAVTAINAPKGTMTNGKQMPPQNAEMMQ